MVLWMHGCLLVQPRMHSSSFEPIGRPAPWLFLSIRNDLLRLLSEPGQPAIQADNPPFESQAAIPVPMKYRHLQMEVTKGPCSRGRYDRSVFGLRKLNQTRELDPLIAFYQKIDCRNHSKEKQTAAIGESGQRRRPASIRSPLLPKKK